MPSETNARPVRVSTGTVAPVGSSAVVTLATIVLVGALVYFANTGDLANSLLGVGVALFVALLAGLGTTRTGILVLMGAFATGPAYKGLAGEGAGITPTDALLVVGFGLLAPEMLKHKLRVPLVYVIGVSIVFSFGLIATVRSERSLESALALVFWLIVMVALPCAVILWAPSRRMVHTLAWTYVIGHFGSWAGGILTGGITPQGRHFGMTQHPNYFAEAAMMAIALCIFLFFEYRSGFAKALVMGAAGVCGLSILLSGSRGATIVVAVLVVMIPIVERSAITGFFYALVAGIGVAGAPYLLELTGNASAIDRLLGGGSAAGSDDARSQGLEAGWDRFWDSPWLGEGLIDLFDIHNNPLQAAVGIGVFGLIGFLLVLFALARPLFERGPYHRLSYTIWAYMGWGLLIPSLYDRTLWIPMCLAALCWIRTGPEDADDSGETDDDPARADGSTGPAGAAPSPAVPSPAVPSAIAPPTTAPSTMARS